ncbi:hypothetical protein [Streptomyces rubradiris]|uniref:Uncharacterized protein n=1 Tax=Streptomyces rubradiris TaxID=285531 RepID=A0ABQ3RAH9_STRRR|nr:hypothetical protein [Streptomyces rubradiris]GHH31498.1 hypothetical protein GCM10018792_79310 [Streptomyces rubradiris]GHI52850.1 hypothetical protein Srubr_26960 [Streptomyces rubradiris]GHI52861.1 hypothetical protein Srubr_27070 [Streptomyces rubradiris]
MTLIRTPAAYTDGEAAAARYRRDLLVASSCGRMLAEAIGRPLHRARHAAQIYRAAVEDIKADRRNAPGRRWLRDQSAVCRRRARIAADEKAMAIENGQQAQADQWAALAAAYAEASEHLGGTVLRPSDAIAMLTAAAEALERATLPSPAQTGQPEGDTPLSSIPTYRIDTGRRALRAARRGEGNLTKHINGVVVELLLFACYAERQHQNAYRTAMQAVRALDRARATAPENNQRDIDPQALAAALELAEQALNTAEAITGQSGETV